MTRIASIGSLDSGLNPHTGLPRQVPDSELKVHEALASALPPGWSAWHSLKIRIKAGVFSEADFVVADLGRGILVLEAAERQLDKAPGLNLKILLASLGASFGTRASVLRNKNNRRGYYCAAFPVDDQIVPLVAYAATRVLPILRR